MTRDPLKPTNWPFPRLSDMQQRRNQAFEQWHREQYARALKAAALDNVRAARKQAPEALL